MKGVGGGEQCRETKYTFAHETREEVDAGATYLQPGMQHLCGRQAGSN